MIKAIERGDALNDLVRLSFARDAFETAGLEADELARPAGRRTQTAQRRHDHARRCSVLAEVRARSAEQASRFRRDFPEGAIGADPRN